MSWLTVTRIVLYYVFLPLVALFNYVLVPFFNFILVLLAPFTHLTFYTAHGLLLPLTFLGKFESLYIFFGVAALIGVITGTFLHFSSSMLTIVFNLHSSPEDQIPVRTAASVRATREKRKLESAWESSGGAAWSSEGKETHADEMKMEYAEFLEQDRGKRKGGKGLLAQTILEEDDDSEENF